MENAIDNKLLAVATDNLFGGLLREFQICLLYGMENLRFSRHVNIAVLAKLRISQSKEKQKQKNLHETIN